MKNENKHVKAQSSFELLVTLAFGLAILLPIVVLAFIQISSANASLSATQAQQAASKLASTATLVGNQGSPAKQVVQIEVPQNVQAIYVGNSDGSIGHIITFVIRSPTGLSYVTSYTPVNVSGDLGPITSVGTYLVNVSATNVCPNNVPEPCTYLRPQT